MTGAEVAERPVLSVATAVRVSTPLPTPFQRNAKGAVASSPILVLPEKNSTLVTEPPGSVAVAARSMFAGLLKTAPFAGLVSVISGGTDVASVVNRESGPEIVDLPSLTVTYHSYSVAGARPFQRADVAFPEGTPFVAMAVHGFCDDIE